MRGCERAVAGLPSASCAARLRPHGLGFLPGRRPSGGGLRQPWRGALRGLRQELDRPRTALPRRARRPAASPYSGRGAACPPPRALGATPRRRARRQAAAARADRRIGQASAGTDCDNAPVRRLVRADPLGQASPDPWAVHNAGGQYGRPDRDARCAALGLADARPDARQRPLAAQGIACSTSSCARRRRQCSRPGSAGQPAAAVRPLAGRFRRRVAKWGRSAAAVRPLAGRFRPRRRLEWTAAGCRRRQRQCPCPNFGYNSGRRRRQPRLVVQANRLWQASIPAVMTQNAAGRNGQHVGGQRGRETGRKIQAARPRVAVADLATR